MTLGLDSRYSNFMAELSNHDIFREIVNICTSNEDIMYYEELVLEKTRKEIRGIR